MQLLTFNRNPKFKSVARSTERQIQTPPFEYVMLRSTLILPLYLRLGLARSPFFLFFNADIFRAFCHMSHAC